MRIVSDRRLVDFALRQDRRLVLAPNRRLGPPCQRVKRSFLLSLVFASPTVDQVGLGLELVQSIDRELSLRLQPGEAIQDFVIRISVLVAVDSRLVE